MVKTRKQREMLTEILPESNWTKFQPFLENSFDIAVDQAILGKTEVLQVTFYTMYNNNYNIIESRLHCSSYSDGQPLRTYDSDRVHLTISAFTLLTY